MSGFSFVSGRSRLNHRIESSSFINVVKERKGRKVIKIDLYELKGDLREAYEYGRGWIRA
jgi:hypothetical protein